MNELQSKLTDMLSWFHDYCQIHQLRYYILGGTMLGAVRHNGFIPWDDDIDVGMPRKDYNRLINEIGNRLVEHYFLETPESEYTEYRYPYAKLYDTSTSLVENTWPSFKRGIFIDVFPLDGFGNTEEECLMRWSEVSKKSNFIWARICALRKERTIIKNTAILIAHLIPDFIAKDKHRLKQLNQLAQKSDYDSMLYGGNTFGNWREKEIMNLSIMGKPTLYKFEDLYVYGPEKYDIYLEHMYGDWRKLPPKEKQVTHHDFLDLDLHKNYR